MTLISRSESEKLVAVVKLAGQSLMQFWPGATRDSQRSLQINTKADGSFVTEADYASNKIIVGALQEMFPQDGIFSEEIPVTAQQVSQSRVWIIDPLDGTKSYIDGNDDFSILVSLCVDDQPKYGLMYFPARQQLAVGQRGLGAVLNQNRLVVSDSDKPRPRSVYLRHLKLPNQEIFYDRWMDSGMAFLNVCNGEFDGLILKIVTHQEWDLAAPAVMLQESGGKISDEFGNPIRFEKGPIKYKYFVASNGRIHQQLLDMIPKN